VRCLRWALSAATLGIAVVVVLALSFVCQAVRCGRVSAFVAEARLLAERRPAVAAAAEGRRWRLQRACGSPTVSAQKGADEILARLHVKVEELVAAAGGDFKEAGLVFDEEPHRLTGVNLALQGRRRITIF
jgi:hypothetical protein